MHRDSGTVNRQTPIRVRFAPTTTGHLHITKVRVALVNWLLARQRGGSLVLRVDDLRAASSSSEAAESLLDDLRWLGFDYDEGVDGNGRFGPYCQSERTEIYRYYVNKLLIEKAAYRCFCGTGSYSAVTDVVCRTDKGCRGGCYELTQDDIDSHLNERRPYVIRLHTPAGEIIFDDMIQGTACFKGETLGDFVLVDSEGAPTPEFATAIDDSLMMITHVIREEGFLSLTPYQMVICRALDLDPPTFGHLAPIVDADGKTAADEYSHATIDWFRNEGFFPESVLCFAAHLAGLVTDCGGHSTLRDFLGDSDVSRILSAAPVFDLESLKRNNRREIASLSKDEMVRRAVPYLERVGFSQDDPRISSIVELYRDQADHLAELAKRASIFVPDNPPMFDMTSAGYLRKDSSQKVLWSFCRNLKSLRRLDATAFTNLMTSVKQEIGIMGKDLWTPVRVALTGETEGPDLPAIAELLGKERCQDLVESALE